MNYSCTANNSYHSCPILEAYIEDQDDILECTNYKNILKLRLKKMIKYILYMYATNIIF